MCAREQLAAAAQAADERGAGGSGGGARSCGCRNRNGRCSARGIRQQHRSVLPRRHACSTARSLLTVNTPINSFLLLHSTRMPEVTYAVRRCCSATYSHTVHVQTFNMNDYVVCTKIVEKDFANSSSAVSDSSSDEDSFAWPKRSRVERRNYHSSESRNKRHRRVLASRLPRGTQPITSATATGLHAADFTAAKVTNSKRATSKSWKHWKLADYEALVAGVNAKGNVNATTTRWLRSEYPDLFTNGRRRETLLRRWNRIKSAKGTVLDGVAWQAVKQEGEGGAWHLIAQATAQHELLDGRPQADHRDSSNSEVHCIINVKVEQFISKCTCTNQKPMVNEQSIDYLCYHIKEEEVNSNEDLRVLKASSSTASSSAAYSSAAPSQVVLVTSGPLSSEQIEDAMPHPAGPLKLAHLKEHLKEHLQLNVRCRFKFKLRVN